MAGGWLSTHVLDTMHGKPAAGLRIDLLMVHGDHTHHVLSTFTNADGRTDKPLLEGDQFHMGTFELKLPEIASGAAPWYVDKKLRFEPKPRFSSSSARDRCR